MGEIMTADQASPAGFIQIRVRYPECDPMGVAHHAAYPVWLEMGRTELLRQTGVSYRQLEAGGVYFAVVELSIRYRSPARYDESLTLTTRVAGTGRARIDHEYELSRDGLVLATARTTVACLDRQGRPQPIPDFLGIATS
jgi:acyl-CoA thioester hydrolase